MPTARSPSIWGSSCRAEESTLPRRCTRYRVLTKPICAPGAGPAVWMSGICIFEKSIFRLTLRSTGVGSGLAYISGKGCNEVFFAGLHRMPGGSGLFYRRQPRGLRSRRLGSPNSIPSIGAGRRACPPGLYRSAGGRAGRRGGAAARAARGTIGSNGRPAIRDERGNRGGRRGGRPRSEAFRQDGSPCGRHRSLAVHGHSRRRSGVRYRHALGA